MDEYNVSQEALLTLLGGKGNLQLQLFNLDLDYGSIYKANVNEVNEFLKCNVPEKIQTFPDKDNNIKILIWYIEK